MQNNPFVHEFKIDLKDLSKEEQLVLLSLIEAGKLIGEIYKNQYNKNFPGSNFYPHNVSKKEIEQEAIKNKEILNPYTMVEKNSDGKLNAIHYHQKFASNIISLTKILERAERNSTDQELKKYLKVVIKSLLEGKYEEAMIAWLTSKNLKINFVIGPIERYDDKLFFKKCAYQSWVGIIDKKATEEAIKFRDIIFTSKRKTIAPVEKIHLQEKITLRIDKTLLFSGLISRFMFTGTNLPNEVKIMEKYGSIITIFLSSLEEKFNSQHFPIFQKVFEKTFQKQYSKEQLKIGTLRNILVHEIAHPLLRFRGAEERLKDLFPVFDEISAYTLGVRSCGLLLLKDVISQKELESIMVMFLCRAYSWWQDYQKDEGVVDYVKGYAIALNFLFESGAIREKDGIFWPNFTKFFVCLDELSHTLEKILASGNYNDASKFLLQYGSLNIFSKFASKI